MAVSGNTVPKTSVRVEHVEQATRILHTWNPGKIRMAKLQADAGSMMLVSDLCEDMIADDSIKGVLGTRVNGLFGLPLEFEANGDKRKSTAITKALEQDWWYANPEMILGQAWSWAVMLGVSPVELVNRERKGRVIPRSKFWSPRWLKYDWTNRVWKLSTQEGEITLEPGNGKWMLFTPGGESRPWVNGAWRAVALWWLLKQYALTDWARYSEAHGSPILAGTMPATAAGDSKARKELASDLSDLGSDSSVALPPGYDLKLIEATANTWQTFQAQIDMADAGIAVAILGQNLTTRVTDGGSRAAASVHNDVRADLRRADAEILSTTTREQQLIYWAEWNFGDRELAPWPKWKTEPLEDLLAKAETYDKIGDALGKLKNAGVNTSPLLEEFGLEAATEPVPPTQLPAPGAPAPAPNSTKPQLNTSSPVDALMRLLERPLPKQPVQLASSAQAFLDGQLYADALGDHALSLDVFKPQLEGILAAISEAGDYEELRTKLLAAHDGMNADDAQEFIARAMVLASMAGQYSSSLDR